MARTIDFEGQAAKRALILDVAQELVYSRGYEQMTIQDLIRETGLSRGALYHYYTTKSAVLESLVERMQDRAEKPLREIAQSAGQTAPEKLCAYFAHIDHARQNQRSLLDRLLRVWYSDENAVIRQKVDSATLTRRAPLLTSILEQGVREGVFAVAHADQAGEAVVVLARGMNDAIARAFLRLETSWQTELLVQTVLKIYEGYAEAIERVVGSAVPILTRPNPEDIDRWLESRTTTGASTSAGTREVGV